MNAAPEIRPRRAWLVWTVLVGGLLGLGLLKFGNPIILDSRIPAPKSLSEAWSEPWPADWGFVAVTALVILGAVSRVHLVQGKRVPHRLPFLLPLAWLAWQLIATQSSVDTSLSHPTTRHFGGLVFCWFMGCILSASHRSWPRWLLIGILLAFAICLVRATNQRLGGFQRDRQMLLEGEKSGWTNFTSADLLEMQSNGMVLSTNGNLVANPMILLKLERARVHGTLVYPNALAGAILLLFPVALFLALRETHMLRRGLRPVVISLTGFLGIGCLYWTGSKSAWLIAMAQLGVVVWHFPIPRRVRTLALSLGVVVGLLAFALRFQGYFAAGATSVSARFDYWRAAVTTAMTHPFVGTGPGTFIRPYAALKAPEAEMTRLVHNDYLEQFSDSGLVGGLMYLAWIGWALTTGGRAVMTVGEPLYQLLWLGTAAWFVQGFVEFSLYIPGLAWIAFTFLGALTGMVQSSVDFRNAEKPPKSIP